MTNLVFFHGWGATGRVWEQQVAAFGPRLRVLTPTIPEWDAGWFLDFLEKLLLAETVLVGWSRGGMLLMEALSRLAGPPPAGLVMVGVPPVFTRRPDYPWGQPLTVVRAMRRALTKDPEPVLAGFVQQCLALGEGAFATQARAAFADGDDAANLATGLDYLLAQDLRPLLPGLPPGAVLIQGEEDRIVEPGHGRFLQEHLAGARLNLLRGAGHLPFLTQTSAFNGLLEQCLNPAG